MKHLTGMKWSPHLSGLAALVALALGACSDEGGHPSLTLGVAPQIEVSETGRPPEVRTMPSVVAMLWKPYTVASPRPLQQWSIRPSASGASSFTSPQKKSPAVSE